MHHREIVSTHILTVIYKSLIKQSNKELGYTKCLLNKHQVVDRHVDCYWVTFIPGVRR